MGLELIRRKIRPRMYWLQARETNDRLLSKQGKSPDPVGPPEEPFAGLAGLGVSETREYGNEHVGTNESYNPNANALSLVRCLVIARNEHIMQSAGDGGNAIRSPWLVRRGAHQSNKKGH